MKSNRLHALLLQRLRRAPPLRADALSSVPTGHGAYLLWLDHAKPLCLKIGIAHPSERGGLRRRLRGHFSSNPDNTVLARHMMADDQLQGAATFDFSSRKDRRAFLATRCYFEVLALPDLTKPKLREFERYAEATLKPRYCGRVGTNGTQQKPKIVASIEQPEPTHSRLLLDEHDQTLVAHVQRAISKALASAHVRVAVVKRLTGLMMRERNRGRVAAKRRYPFKGICEASGKPLQSEHAHLDELDPELGYAGRLRWVCPRANNSGKYSCGGCK